MKIKSLLFIILCAANSVQAGETKSWGQWITSVFSKKQAAVIGGVAVIGAGVSFTWLKWGKKRTHRHPFMRTSPDDRPNPTLFIRKKPKSIDEVQVYKKQVEELIEYQQQVKGIEARLRGELHLLRLPYDIDNDHTVPDNYFNSFHENIKARYDEMTDLAHEINLLSALHRKQRLKAQKFISENLERNNTL